MLDAMRDIAVPDLDDPLFAPFWQGMAEKRLLIQFCPASGEYYWPPRIRCHKTGSTEMEWIETAPTGTLYSFVTVGKSMIKGFDAPYTIGLVSLNEHPSVRMVGICRSEQKLAIGQPMAGRFVPAGPDGEFVVLQWVPSTGE